tara:strand:- start:157 stop:450 length:294 start_codon:yes stop_codon:yes gene_type:complete
MIERIGMEELQAELERFGVQGSSGNRVTIAEIQESFPELEKPSRDLIRKKIKNGIQHGIVKYAGRKFVNRIDGTKATAPCYVFTEEVTKKRQRKKKK